MTVTFVAVGHYAGKNFLLNSIHNFQNGEYEYTGSAESLSSLKRYFASFNIHMAGSKELAAAQEYINGVRDNTDSSEGSRQESGVSGTDKQTSDGAGQEASTPVNESSETGSSEEEGGDSDSDGGGQEVSGSVHEVSQELNVVLVKAIMSLDPTNDDHWTAAGKPAMSAVEEAYGNAGVTREDVDNNAPDWDRDSAHDALLNSLTS